MRTIQAVAGPVAQAIFVDAILLPDDAARWPTVGAESEFEVWWADERTQLRLKPTDPGLLREDFLAWQARFRPSWPLEQGRPVVADGDPSNSTTS